MRLALLGSNADVGVVAGDTAQLQRTDWALKALALVHLLDMGDGLGVLAALPRSDQHRPELGQRQAGPIIEQAPARPKNARFALQMALFTHRVAQNGGQTGGVDDGVVHAAPHVQFARPMTALTADRAPLEHRRLETIGVFGIFADAVGVAEQTGGGRHTPRQGRRHEPRRQVPALLPREPADRRLQQVAVLFRQVGIALRAGADHPADFLGQFDDGFARIVEHGLPVPNRTPLAFHLKASAQGNEGIAGVPRRRSRAGRGLSINRVRNRRQGSSHGMASIAPGDVFMATHARRIACILNIRVDVPIGAGVGPPWVGRGGRRRRPGTGSLRYPAASTRPDVAQKARSA